MMFQGKKSFFFRINECFIFYNKQILINNQKHEISNHNLNYKSKFVAHLKIKIIRKMYTL